jgi:hypothetical protein
MSNDLMTLFDIAEVKIGEIEKELTRRYKDKEQAISFADICDEVVEDTTYLESAIRSALKGMEENKAITVNRATSKMPRG